MNEMNTIGLESNKRITEMYVVRVFIGATLVAGGWVLLLLVLSMIWG